VLAVHTLVAAPTEDLDSWLDLVTMCRKEGMHVLCENLLRQLGAPIMAKSRCVRAYDRGAVGGVYWGAGALGRGCTVRV